MKITQRQLRKLINEELHRLTELHPGSNLSSYLKQGVAKLWEADNLVKKALAEAEDDQMHKVIENIHGAIEKLAFGVDAQMQKIGQGSSFMPAKRASMPSPKKVN